MLGCSNSQAASTYGLCSSQITLNFDDKLDIRYMIYV
jgi:hypothetical protein